MHVLRCEPSRVWGSPPLGPRLLQTALSRPGLLFASCPARLSLLILKVASSLGSCDHRPDFLDIPPPLGYEWLGSLQSLPILPRPHLIIYFQTILCPAQTSTLGPRTSGAADA